MHSTKTYSFLAVVALAVLASALFVTPALACPDGDNLYVGAGSSAGTSAAAPAAQAAPAASTASAPASGCTPSSCCSAACTAKHGSKAGDCSGCAAHAAMCKSRGCGGAGAAAAPAPAAESAPSAAGKERWKGLPDSMIQKLEALSGQPSSN